MNNEQSDRAYSVRAQAQINAVRAVIWKRQPCVYLRVFQGLTACLNWAGSIDQKRQVKYAFPNKKVERHNYLSNPRPTLTPCQKTTQTFSLS